MFCFAWFAVHTTILTCDGLSDEIQKTDVAVVLGSMVKPDGTPSARLKGRLDEALQLYKDKYFPYVIVSGGIDPEGHSEARVMKNYLLKRGIPKSAIFEDAAGNNTYLTAVHTISIMKEKNFQSVLVVSQFFHISRLKLTFAKLGIKKVFSAHVKYYEARDIYSTVREFFAFYRYLFKGR